MAKVVGICGTIGTGKDTAARFFTEEKSFTSMSIADPLKLIIQELFDIPGDILWGPSQRRTVEVRRMLQLLGDYARSFDSDVWIKKLLHRTTSWMYTGKDVYELREPDEVGNRRNIVIPDVRFPNEVEALVKVHNAKIIRLQRPDLQVDMTDETTRHITETIQEDIPDTLITATLTNAGSVDDLWAKLRGFCMENGL